MIWVLAFALLMVVIFNFVGFSISSPKYSGPRTDHFNGKTFENPGDVKAKGLTDVIKWASNRKRQPWIVEKEPYIGPEPAGQVKAGIKITFVNHSTFLIQANGMNILTDPVWSDRTSPFRFAGPKRMRPPGITFEDLPKIDLVIISHNHYDHLDVSTMRDLIKHHNPGIITPLGVGEFVRKMGTDNVEDLDWWQEQVISDDMNIVCVPAQHFSGRGTFDRDATLWCGYIIQSKSGNIYFAGDSGYGDFFKLIGRKYGKMKVSMIPIGAYLPQWFMSPIHISPEEAVKVHQDVNSEISIAMHYGTFPLADDGQQQPILDLKDAINRSGLNKDEFVLLDEGKSLVLKD